MIQAHDDLTHGLESVIAYPEPFRYPYRYRVDALLPDDLDLERFRKVTVALRECFKGRRFRIGAAPAVVTVAPSSLYRSPLTLLGSPDPFLREHLQRHARTIFGATTVSFRGSFGRERLIEWCRIFLPYHFARYRRNLHTDAWPDGAARLAALTLFLEGHEIVTDLPTLLERYVDHVPGCRVGSARFERLLAAPAVSANDPHRLTESLTFLAREFDRVESALTRSTPAGEPERERISGPSR